MISKKTSTDIALAHREIETAEKLLKEIEDAMGRRETPDLRDAFGHQRGLQLGVPSGQNGHRLFDVPWVLARPIIEAHIASQRSVVKVLSIKAIAEAQTEDRAE